MSVRVQSRVWEHSKQKGGALVLLLAIADFADDAGVAFPSVDTLAQKSRMSDRNVQLCLRALEGSGELEVIPSGGPKGCHLYRVLPHQGEKISPRKDFTPKRLQGEKTRTKGVKPASPEPPTEPPKEKEEPPLPPTVQRFDAVLRGVPGYDPEALFLRKVAEKYGALDLEEEALKLSGWLVDHPKRHYTSLFCLSWLSRALSTPVPVTPTPLHRPHAVGPAVPADSPFLRYVK